MRRLTALLALAAALTFAFVGALRAETRVALVIGNGAYKHAPELINPVNDANDISAALKDLGFHVFSGTDEDLRGMENLIDRFADAAELADVALFYFAGHAFQANDRNYLAPVDLELNDPSKVIGETLPLDRVMEALQHSPGIRLLFLDACRDDPLGLQGSSGSGLARIGSSADFMIAYATQPGAVAFDGDGRNGIFSEAVLNHIRSPGEDISNMMIAVRKDVIAATGGQQVPWENSSLTRSFQFNPGTGPDVASPETVLYQVAVRAHDPGLMKLYLKRFPDGAHAQDVQTFLASADTGQGGTRLRGLSPTQDTGDELFALAQQTRIRELYESYLALYPEGKHAAEAKQRAAELPREADLGPGRKCETLATHPRDASAGTPGVPFARLVQNASEAIKACTAATQAFPEQPRYKALLARALWAADLRDQAVPLYEEAAAAGDLRAMVSLGLLHESGDGVSKDPAAAIALYEQAADKGSPDAAINLAVALYQGSTVPQDIPRALQLFQKASAAGSAIATFNLGALAQQGGYATPADALPLFERAAREGEPRGYRAAAVLLDEGRGIERNPARAAVLLLLGIAGDDGTTLADFTSGSDTWHDDTIAEMQRRLKASRLYDGTVDGKSGPRFLAALEAWRNGGLNQAVLAN